MFHIELKILIYQLVNINFNFVTLLREKTRKHTRILQSPTPMDSR